MNNIERVQALYEAFGRGDAPAILDQLADDVQWDRDAPSYGIPFYEPGTGKEHVLRFFQTIDEELEFLEFQPLNFLSGGDQVAVPVNVKVRVKSTGNVLEALEIHLWTFNNKGKIGRLFHCIDRHAVVLAYGAEKLAALES